MLYNYYGTPIDNVEGIAVANSVRYLGLDLCNTVILGSVSMHIGRGCLDRLFTTVH